MINTMGRIECEVTVRDGREMAQNGGWWKKHTFCTHLGVLQ